MTAQEIGRRAEREKMIKKVISDKQVEFTDKKEAADFGLNKKSVFQH